MAIKNGSTILKLKLIESNIFPSIIACNVIIALKALEFCSVVRYFGRYIHILEFAADKVVRHQIHAISSVCCAWHIQFSFVRGTLWKLATFKTSQTFMFRPIHRRTITFLIQLSCHSYPSRVHASRPHTLLLIHCIQTISVQLFPLFDSRLADYLTFQCWEWCNSNGGWMNR